MAETGMNTDESDDSDDLKDWDESREFSEWDESSELNESREFNECEESHEFNELDESCEFDELEESRELEEWEESRALDELEESREFDELEESREFDELDESREMEEWEESRALDDLEESREFDELEESREFDELEESREFEELEESRELEEWEESHEFDELDESREFDECEESRELDELEESRELDEWEESREFDELEESREFDELEESREFDELEESRENDELEESREFDEYEESRTFYETEESCELDELEESREFDELEEYRENDEWEESREFDELEESRELDEWEESRELDECEESRELDECEESRELDEWEESRALEECEESRELDECEESRELDEAGQFYEINEFDESEMSDESEESGNSQIEKIYIRESLPKSNLKTRNKVFYPLELVPLFSVDGPERRTPFSFIRSYQRLIKEINRLKEIQPDGCKTIIKKRTSTTFKMEHYNTSDRKATGNVTRFPLCLFRDDLLPDSHKDKGTEAYATELLKKLRIRYAKGKNSKKVNYKSMKSSQSQSSDCTALYLKVKRQNTELDLEANTDTFENSNCYPTQHIGIKHGITANLLRLQNYNSIETQFVALTTHIKQILGLKIKQHVPPSGRSLKTGNFKVGKTTVRQREDRRFDSCNVETWDSTLISNRFSKYRTELSYDDMVVLCAVTPDIVPIDLHVTETVTTISIQELLALSLERALLLYFRYHPISNMVCNGQTKPGRTNKDFGNNIVIYIAYQFKK